MVRTFEEFLVETWPWIGEPPFSEEYLEEINRSILKAILKEPGEILFALYFYFNNASAIPLEPLKPLTPLELLYFWDSCTESERLEILLHFN